MLKRFWMGILTILCSIGITIAISYAWFVNGYDVDPLATGSSKDAYYYSGDGSSEKPFIITNARHLYNLAWLQYLGYYNKPSEVTNGKYKTYYFQLGIDGEHPVTLDMSNWPLPPIGTTKYPFIGNFNGNGSTIENLTTTNKFSEFGTKHPSTVTSIQDCNVIGFFGSVGAFDKTIINSDVQSESNSVGDNNEIKSFNLNNSKVHTTTSDTCLGAVAGYVNAPISNVGVIQPHLNIQAANTTSTSITSKTSDNISDFAVVGYAEAEYTTQKTKNSTIIYNPTYNYTHFNFKGMGDQNDWGGSMNMDDLYHRILSKIPAGTNKSTTYVSEEIQYVNINKDVIPIYSTTTSLVSNVSNNEDGNYAKYNRTNTEDYNYLKSLYKNVIIVTKTDTIENGYIISNKDGNVFLDITSKHANNTTNFNVSLNNGSSNQRVWVYKNNRIYTYNEDDGYIYYLNGTTSDLSVSTTASTTWNYDSTNKAFYFTNGMNYYLKYYRGSWCTTPTYAIADGSGNYLKSTGTNDATVTNTTSLSDATTWEFSTNGADPYGTITTYDSGSRLYLRLNNDNLITSTTSTIWSNSGSGLNYNSNYIQIRNGYWVAMANPAYKIGSGTHYLSTIGTDTTADNAALWTLGNTVGSNGGSGTISMRIKGALKYLSNNNGTLAVNATSTTWYNDSGKLYSTYNNQRYYLIYDNGWKLDVEDFYIKDQNSNYLTFNNSTSVTNATSPTTLWHFSNASGTYPIGTISCISGGTTYYLNKNGNTLELSTNYTTWANDGDGLYCTDNSVKYYLVYDGTWKLVSYTYKIKSGTDYLSLDGNNIIRTDEASATEWTFSNSGANPSGTISSNGRYLYIDENGILATTTTVGNALSFNNTGSGLYDSNNNYIQYYNQKWVCGKAFYIKYGDTYMSYNLGTTSNWKWFYYSNTNDPQGVIYTVNNGTAYYLYNDNGTLTCNANSTTNWLRDTNGLYDIYDGNKYIQYDSGWKLASPRTTTYNRFYISRTKNGTTHYLILNNTQIGDSTSKNPSAGKWVFTTSGATPQGQIYQVVDGTKYFLHINNGNLSVSTTESHTFTNDNGKLKDNNTGYYLYDNDRNLSWRWQGNSSARAYTFTNCNDPITVDDYENTPFGATTNLTNDATTPVSSTSNNRSTYVSENYASLSFTSVSNNSLTQQIYNSDRIESTTNIYTRQENSVQPSVFNYIPLNAATTSPYTVANNNTGYIMSGSYENSSYHADIRVSKYDMTDIKSSYSNSTKNWTDNGILTVGENGYSTAKKIGSTYYPESNFSKFESSKSQLLETLKSASNVYGLHFMNSSININHLVTTPKVLINGVRYINYQMPEDCIDFQLASKGYINFFAGTYFSKNDSFFSLHQIFRDETDANDDGIPDNPVITEIKHISKIYKANSTYGDGYKSLDFIYEYTDGSWSGENVSSNSKYTLAFDKAWIEAPETVSGSGGDLYNSFRNYLWYFEIPVNKGEYALGSVDGGTGAYLIYLDIGANAAPVDRTEIRQQTQYTQESLLYANGIQILASGSSYDNTNVANTAVAIIPATPAPGEITITRTGDTIEFNRELNSTYYDPGITLTNGTLSPISSSSRVLNVLKYIDYKRTDDRVFYTTIYNDGSTNTSYDCYEINNSTGEVIKQITETGDGADWGLLKIDNGSGVETTVTDSYFNFPNNLIGTTKILDYYSMILTSELNTYSDTNAMRVVEDGTVQAPNDGEYLFEHSYSITGNDITMAPNRLVVYIGPDFKTSATINGSTSNVVTVTTVVNAVTYTFTFNANAIDNTAKTVTIYYVSN